MWPSVDTNPHLILFYTNSRLRGGAGPGGGQQLPGLFPLAAHHADPALPPPPVHVNMQTLCVTLSISYT